MKEYIEVLKTVPLFLKIQEDDLLTVLNCLSAKVINYNSNATILREGDPAQWVGIVLSGGVQVVRNDLNGNRNIVTSVGKGELFGEAFACADIDSLPVTALASCDSIIMLINYKKIITACASCCAFHNRIIFNMLKIIADKNVQLHQKIQFTSKRTTKEKLMVYLNYEAKKAGSRCFSIDFNRQELADFLFVDRSAMSNELCKLRNEGVLKFNKNKFELL